MRTLLVLLMVSGYTLLAGAQPVAAQPAAARPHAEWRRVRALEPGSEIVLTVTDDRPAHRYVIAVDNDSLRVLNLTDSPLAGRLTETLRSIASEHPEYFDRVAADGTVIVGDVRLSRTGVFVGNDQVGDWQRLVETHARHEVAEIASRRQGRGFWGHLGPLGGYFVGGMAGGLAFGVACRAVNGTNRCDNGAFLVGMVGGGVAGGAYGWYAARRETEEIVYRAP